MLSSRRAQTVLRSSIAFLLAGLVRGTGFPAAPVLFRWEATAQMVTGQSPEEAAIDLRLRVSESHYVTRDRIRFELARGGGLRLAPAQWPPAENVSAPGSAEPVAAYSGEVLFPLTLQRTVTGAGQEAAAVPVRIVVTCQAFSPEVVFLPAQQEVALTVLFPAAAARAPSPAGPDAPEGVAPPGRSEEVAEAPAAAEEPRGAPPPVRPASADSGWPVQLLLGLLVAALLFDPPAVQSWLRPGGVNAPILLGTLLGVLAFTGAGGLAGALLAAIERTGVSVRSLMWSGVAGCLVPGLGYWIAAPRPPWKAGAAPHPPAIADASTLRDSGLVAVRLLRHNLRYAWPAVLGSWSLLAGRGTPPVHFALASGAFAAGAFAASALAALGWSPSTAPRYITGALGIGYLVAALHLLCVLFPAIRPPHGFPFAQYLVSLILVVIGVILGAVDRPLLRHGRRVAAVKVAGTCCCILGLFRLTTGVEGPRPYYPDVPSPKAAADAEPEPGPPALSPPSSPAAS